MDVKQKFNSASHVTRVYCVCGVQKLAPFSAG